MKRFVFSILGLLLSLCLFGQTRDGLMTYNNGSYYLDGQIIEKSDLADVFGYRYVDAEKALSKRTKGFWELGCGTAAIVGGLVWTSIGNKHMNEALDGIPDDGNDITGLVVGPSMAVAGLICDIFGVIHLTTGISSAKKVATEYNSRQSSSVTFGTTTNGIGFALIF